MRRVAAVLLSACVAGCQADSAAGPRAPVLSSAAGAVAATSAAEASPPFHCPAAGTRVTFADGGSLEFLGADGADPLLCVMTNADGSRLRRLYNIPELPFRDETVRAALATLWPMSPGKEAYYTLVRRFNGGTTFRLGFHWRVLRAETLTIGGEPRRTWVVERTESLLFGSNRSTVDTVWYDEATWQAVRRESNANRGEARIRPFEVERITAPASGT